MVEVFSGEGRLGRAFARRGFQVVLWDVRNGDQFDLTRPSNVRALLRLCRGAHFVHLAPPCSSFSIARGANAPRSRAYPMGKPELGDSDRAKVQVGNMLVKVCIQVVHQQSTLQRAWSLEQPKTSRMWLCPPLTRALLRCGARSVTTCFCAWGTAWRKDATFAYGGCPRLASLGRTCSSRDGRCQHSQHKHQVLQGNGPGGKPWTLIAQPYPSRLCRAFAAAVEQHFIARFIRELDSGRKAF